MGTPISATLPSQSLETMAAKRRASRKPRRRTKRVSKRRVSRKKRVTRRKRTKRKVVRRKRKARRVSIRGSKQQVWRGSRLKARNTGYQKKDFMQNKRGRIISKKAHSAGMRAYKRNGLSKWTKAFVQARKNLKLKGFVACKKGTAFYKEAMRLYKKK